MMSEDMAKPKPTREDVVASIERSADVMFAKPKSVGVVVGRFQYIHLTDAHRMLLQGAAERHDALVVLVGASPMWGTSRNPLPANIVRYGLDVHAQCGLDPSYPVYVGTLEDRYSDEVWVSDLLKAIDKGVETLSGDDKTPATIYSGPDGVCPFLRRNIDLTLNTPRPLFVVDMEQVPEPPHATTLRNEINYLDWDDQSAAFKAGMIYARNKMKPRVFLAVDALIMGTNGSFVLGSKASIAPFRCLIGGMVDENDFSIEDALYREVQEETGLTRKDIAAVRQIGQAPFLIDDWRGARVFSVPYVVYAYHDTFDAIRANDDIDELHIVTGDQLRRNTALLLPQHQPIIEEFYKRMP